ncbi:hypothetical protein BST97_05440 [Nonlabens spongiae]|uniref:Uncharacterized protein n=1 Tax=Nonlabens spongiae TaxID=331648 RepID=A0A1W6MIQ3_9FLAO|nr:hypothetical protein [Nonlabens spongiae]ARN77473.1 hypothetical protein BST97_05440 [Nonlabens spongiae]
MLFKIRAKGSHGYVANTRVALFFDAAGKASAGNAGSNVLRMAVDFHLLTRFERYKDFKEIENSN